MSLRFAAVVIVVLFLGAPSLESIGARAQTQATPTQCRDACAAANRVDDSVIRGYINQGISLCDCACSGARGGGILHVSARSGCGVCISLLTSSPSNCICNDRDFGANTPLHIAASICNGPTTSDFIRAGCNVNAVNSNGNTPLCRVARSRSGPECGQVARTLVRAGGPACRRCGDGQTPCGGCVQQGVCDVLEQDGACNC